MVARKKNRAYTKPRAATQQTGAAAIRRSRARNTFRSRIRHKLQDKVGPRVAGGRWKNSTYFEAVVDALLEGPLNRDDAKMLLEVVKYYEPAELEGRIRLAKKRIKALVLGRILPLIEKYVPDDQKGNFAADLDELSFYSRAGIATTGGSIGVKEMMRKTCGGEDISTPRPESTASRSAIRAAHESLVADDDDIIDDDADLDDEEEVDPDIDT